MTAPISELCHRPVVLAPMGGGPTTPELVIAAAGAGAVGFLAGAYKSAAAVSAEIAAVKAATDAPFGVNLFVPGAPSDQPQQVEAYVASLADEARAVDAVVASPSWDDDGFDAKVAALLGDPPALVTFTFGCPPAAVRRAIQAAGALVGITVTKPEEAVLATAAGADFLCVQGPEAGAHRGTFVNTVAPTDELGLIALIGAVAAVTDLPQIAAGGIMHPQDVAAVIDAGAVAALCGTAFLRCPESGAHPVYKAALVDPRFTTTVVTRAFSGRPARGLRNGFIAAHPDAPPAYPEINNATRPLRAAAAARGDADRMSLWAGQGFASASDRPVAEVIDMLCGDVLRGDVLRGDVSA